MRSSAPTITPPICGLAILLSFGCDGGGTDPSDASTRGPDGSTTDSGPVVGADGGPAALDGGPAPLDGGGGLDGGPGLDGGGPGPACVPTSGAAMTIALCGTLELAIIDDGTGSVEASLRGRLRPIGLADDGCAVVDSVEVQEDGVTIGMLSGVRDFSRSWHAPTRARGEASPEMVSRCGGDENRFDGFGIIVRGRMDGGSFEARCADAADSEGWPPALVVTCHENVDEQPEFGGGVELLDLGEYEPGLMATSFEVYMHHGPGGAITSADGTVRVIPQRNPRAGYPVISPFDIPGFEVNVDEVGPAEDTSWLVFNVRGDDPLEEVCPIGPIDPDPDPGGEAVMLLRFTGTGERGAYSSEAFIDFCDRPPPG